MPHGVSSLRATPIICLDVRDHYSGVVPITPVCSNWNHRLICGVWTMNATLPPIRIIGTYFDSQVALEWNVSLSSY